MPTADWDTFQSTPQEDVLFHSSPLPAGDSTNGVLIKDFSAPTYDATVSAKDTTVPTIDATVLTIGATTPPDFTVPANDDIIAAADVTEPVNMDTIKGSELSRMDESDSEEIAADFTDSKPTSPLPERVFRIREEDSVSKQSVSLVIK